MNSRLRFALIGLAVFVGGLGATVLAVSLLDDGAEAQAQVVRWGNLTVQVTKGSGVFAAPDYALTDEGKPVLILKKGDSFVELDAETGIVVEERIANADRAAIQKVLATLEVSEQDVATAPWPHSDTLRPCPGSGLGT